MNQISSFFRQSSALDAVSQFPSLRDHVPKVLKADSRSSVLVLSYPSLHWATLLQLIEDSALGLDTLLELEQKLRCYIELLYANGVAYCIKQNCVFPVKQSSGRWTLYLGGWKDISFHPAQG